MVHKPFVTEYRDLQAVLHKAMKAFEIYDTDPDDPDSLTEARRRWDEAVRANDALMAASAETRRSSEVSLR